MQPSVSSPSPLDRRRGWKKLFLSLLAFVAVFVLLLCFVVMSGLVAYHRVVSRYHALRSQSRTIGAAVPGRVAAAPPVQPMELARPCASLPAREAATLHQQQAKAVIPVVPGLVLDDIWTLYDADIETLVRVTTVDDAQVQLTSSGPLARAVNGKAIVGPSKVIPVYPQCQADLASSHLLVTEGNPEISVPLSGVTRYSVSQAVYEEIKAGKPFPFEYRYLYEPVGAGYSWRHADRGEMQTDVLGPFSFKVIVNGKQIDLPALHVTGLLKNMPTQMTVLDDPNNPLLLDFEIPQLRFALRLAQITHPVAKKIEDDLQESGKAEVYGIYFDFDSAQIRPESEPVLSEIAEALRSHPDWRLGVQGHTDNIGGDAHNQLLSARRAEAVKGALVQRYSIAPSRLTTAGFGAAQPKAPNDTTEGRALNRRVELIRQG